MRMIVTLRTPDRDIEGDCDISNGCVYIDAPTSRFIIPLSNILAIERVKEQKPIEYGPVQIEAGKKEQEALKEKRWLYSEDDYATRRAAGALTEKEMEAEHG